MTITKRRLYGRDGIVTVRDARDAVDASDWTPDNLSAGEISGGVTTDSVTLDAREWEDLRVVACFTKLGVPDPGGSVGVFLLMSIPDATGTCGRLWREMGTAVTLTSTISTLLEEIDGHDVAVRIDALTLGTADAVTLKITG